jgi:hypothetical protein
MRSIILSLVALVGMNLWAQTTDVQFQAHVPFTATEVSFSAYIADSSFDEGSRLNSTALWYVEGKVVPVNNSMINVLLQNIPDSIFTQNYGRIYVYSYVNGTPMGKLPFHRLPYALHSNHSDLAGRSDVSNFAQDAKFAEYADTSDYSKNAGHSVLTDTATYSVNGGHSVNADTAMFSWTAQRSRITEAVDTNGVANYSIQDGVVTTTKISNGSVVAEKLADNSVENRHVSDNAITLDNLAGNQSATVGSYVTKGVNGISWEVNPHHKTTSVMIYTQAPGFLPTDSRWVVSRVAVDYQIATVQNPSVGQLVTIYNGSTANNIFVDATTWNIDTGMSSWIGAGQSRTLWYSGFNWVVIQ